MITSSLYHNNSRVVNPHLATIKYKQHLFTSLSFLFLRISPGLYLKSPKPSPSRLTRNLGYIRCGILHTIASNYTRLGQSEQGLSFRYQDICRIDKSISAILRPSICKLLEPNQLKFYKNSSIFTPYLYQLIRNISIYSNNITGPRVFIVTSPPKIVTFPPKKTLKSPLF